MREDEEEEEGREKEREERKNAKSGKKPRLARCSVRFYTRRLNRYVDVYIVSACRVAFQGGRDVGGEGGEGIETGI